ncbi:MAG: alpha/beta hydrolase family esterase [Dehalococcoidia bacterium]
MSLRPVAASFALALVALTAIACGGREGADGEPASAPVVTTALASPLASATSTRPAAAPTPAPSPRASPKSPSTGNGCTASLPVQLRAGATAVLTVTSESRQRAYRLHVPAKVDPTKPAPLVLNFHGLGSNGAEQEVYSGLLPVSDREGFYLVSPDGTGEPRAWNILNLPILPDDDQFVRDLIAEVERLVCIDPLRVYSTGMSNGAFFSSQLACRLADQIAAIAPVAGVRKPGAGCDDQTPVLAFHGVEDGVVPFEAGRVLNVLSYDGARAETAAWAKQNGCAAESTASRVADHVTRESYSGCAAGNETALVVVDDGGHTWPGSVPVASLGKTNREISAAELIWAFFRAHPLK